MLKFEDLTNLDKNYCFSTDQVDEREFIKVARKLFKEDIEVKVFSNPGALVGYLEYIKSTRNNVDKFLDFPKTSSPLNLLNFFNPSYEILNLLGSWKIRMISYLIKHWGECLDNQTLEYYFFLLQYANKVLISENGEKLLIVTNPLILKINGDRRLHSQDSPALKFNNADSHYFWDGTKVSSKVITKQFKVYDIDNEPNAEIRRCMIEIIGISHYLKSSKFELIDCDEVPIRKGFSVMLPRMLIRDKRGEQWFVSSDGSTKRVYFLPTIRSVRTCKEAHQLMCGYSEDKIIAQG